MRLHRCTAVRGQKQKQDGPTHRPIYAGAVFVPSVLKIIAALVAAVALRLVASPTSTTNNTTQSLVYSSDPNKISTRGGQRTCISCSGAQRLRTAATAGVGSVIASASFQFLRRVAPASESSKTMPGQSSSFTCHAPERAQKKRRRRGTRQGEGTVGTVNNKTRAAGVSTQHTCLLMPA